MELTSVVMRRQKEISGNGYQATSALVYNGNIAQKSKK